MNIEEIPLPPEARQGEINGGYEVELDAATNTILSGLKKDYKTVGEKILFLPGETDSSKIFAFYEPKMIEKGFVRDANVPPSGRNYQIAVWHRSDDWLGRKAVVAAAVIEAGKDADGKPIKFLAVYTAEN